MGDHRRHVEIPRLRRRLDGGEERGPPFGPPRAIGARERARRQRVECRAHRGGDRHGGPVGGPDVAGVGVDEDEFDPRLRRRPHRPRVRGHLPEAHPQPDDTVGLGQRRPHRCRHGDAGLARVAGVVVVEHVVEAEGGDDGHVEGLGHLHQGATGVFVPSGTADEEDGTSGRREAIDDGVDLGRVRGRWARRRHRRGRARGGRGEDVLGEGDHDRTGTATPRPGEGLVDHGRDVVGRTELGDPLRDPAEHLLVVDFLERFAAEMGGGHLTDEEHHGSRRLAGGVDADRRIGGARAAGDETDPRLAGELAPGLGHERGTTLVSAGDDPDVGVEQGIEDREVALTGHAERGADGVGDEAFDDRLAPGAVHAFSSVT